MIQDAESFAEFKKRRIDDTVDCPKTIVWKCFPVYKSERCRECWDYDLMHKLNKKEVKPNG